MNNNLQKALKDNLQDIVDAGLNTTFTQKRLKKIGVKFPVIKMSSSKIKKTRKATNLSQSLFAQLLNVSASSVKHWEQGEI